MSKKSKITETSRQILNSSKRRITNQRTLLLDILRKEGGHLDAGELYQRACQKHPRLSLSTVYRNLQLFKKLGLVDEHHFNEEHHHYEVKSGGEHYHLLCLGCGKIIEIESPSSDQLRDDIARAYGFKISGIEMRIVGLCSDCS